MARTEKGWGRAELARFIQHEMGVPQIAALKMIERILHHICASLSKGEDVKIANFGVFKLRDKAARMGRNPRNKLEVLIPPHRVLTFRPSDSMRRRLAAN